MWPKAVWWAQWHAVDWDEALHSEKHTLLEPALKKSHAFRFSIFHLTAILTVLSNLFLSPTLCLHIFLHFISDYILLLCLFHVCTSSSFMHSTSAHWRLTIPSSGQILKHITLMILCFHIHFWNLIPCPALLFVITLYIHFVCTMSWLLHCRMNCCFSNELQI